MSRPAAQPDGVRSAAYQAFWLLRRLRDRADPVNRLTNDPPQYYDVALRDFGLLLGALTLSRLAFAFRATARVPALEDEQRRVRLHRAA